MKGRILPTEKYCADCPLGRLFCKKCEYSFKTAYDSDHIYCTHPDADTAKPLFDTETGKGLTPRKDEYAVLVRRGDALFNVLVQDHPAIALQEAARRRRRKRELEQKAMKNQQRPKRTLLGRLLTGILSIFPFFTIH